MLTFGKLKDRARFFVRGNYWKCVLVSFIYMFLSGQGLAVYQRMKYNGGLRYHDSLQTLVNYGYWRWVIFFLFIVAVLTFIVVVFYTLYSIFFKEFLNMGLAKFYLRNRVEKAEVADLFSVFQKQFYLKNVMIFFQKNLTIFLWTLLLIVPGIIKDLELSMVHYILAEQPYLTKDEVFQISKDLTDGNKMRIFTFRLSFFFWFILSGITCGLAQIFWVGPYYDAANAEFYKDLVEEYNRRFTRFDEEEESFV